MFKTGQNFGPYALIRKLAKGGFGEVWLAEKKSPLVTKQVAVKLPHAGQVDFSAIRREATLWEQASGHPNVLPLLDADIHDGQVVIASEYVADGSLADLLRKQGKIPFDQAARIAVGVLNGLEYLHSKNILHRDIKPADILMQGDVPRLTDFGISRATETTLVSSTVVGTRPYMSPEAFEGVRNVKTDLWSVGVLLYHLSTGRLPFPLGRPTEIMYSILLKEPEPLPDEIPPLLRQIIYKALEKDRELGDRPPRRYQTAAEMREDLENFLGWFASQSAPAETGDAAAVAAATVATAEPSHFETVRFSPATHDGDLATRMRIPIRARRRASTTHVFALILAVGGAVALLSVFMFSQPSSSSSSSGAAADANSSNVNATAAEQPEDAAVRAAREFHRQADDLYARKKYDKAIETYTLAIELNPNDYALFNNRGAAYHADGELRRAIADYTKAVELNPYHFSAYNNRGAAYEDVGSVEQAVADYRKALELDPENKLAKDNLKKILK